MSLFEHSTRTRVVDAVGGIERLGELAAELGARRAFVVTSPAVAAAGHAAAGARSLAASGLAVESFDATAENPTSDDVDVCLRAARAFAPDLFVGIGGGSAIDTAKGVNFLLCCGGEMRDYRGRDRATAALLPLIAVPTTAGTGTEVQSFALIGDPETKQKMACGDPTAAPRFALLDARLTLTQPAFVTACTGLDAIGHAVETAVTRARTELSSRYSTAAFTVAVGAFPTVLAEPANLDARADMLRAAALAGLAIEHSMLGAAHAMANPLTARFGVVHGQAVGTALPRVVRFNAQAADARAAYARLARAARVAAADSSDDEATERLVSTLEGFVRAAGLPLSLGDSGVGAADCAALAEEAAGQWTAQFNPRPVQRAEFEALFEAAVGD